MEILNLTGFLKGSLVFSELCPDSKCCFFEEIQVLRPNLGLLLCYGDMSLCPSGRFITEGMSQGACHGTASVLIV